MDFMSRGRGPEMPAPMPPTGHSGRRKRFLGARLMRIEWFTFASLIAIILLIVIGWSIFSTNWGYSEKDQIDTTKYQAVFLNAPPYGTTGYAGSLYFGHITKMTEKYVILKQVYYLTTTTTGTDQSQQNQQLSLTKLGCQQLHAPYDELVINRDQVAWWENLQDSGKVVQAIKQFVKQNPNGPNCSQTSNSSSSNSSNTSNTSSSSSSNQ